MRRRISSIARKNALHFHAGSCRRLFLFAIAAVLMLATGCGSAEPAAPATGRTISHAMGSTVVPAEPQRVVVLDTQELDAALSLGVVPVGATRSTVDEELPSFLAGRTPAGVIELVGTIPEPDLEAIARLQPDLILSSKFRHETIYEKLSAIAPTVFAERTGDAWKQNFLLYADALGRKPEAQRQLDEYHSRAAALGDRISAPSTVVSVVRFMSQEIRLYTPASFIGTVLADVGLARPEVVQGVPEVAVKISPEQIGMATGDVIFTTTFGPVESTQKATVTALWVELPAVQAGRVYEVSDDVWMLAIGPTGANLVLDDIERHLG